MLKFHPTPGFTEHIYEFSSEIPEIALPFIREELIENLGQVARIMFSEFALAFPLTMKAIEDYWPDKPKFVATESDDWWTYQIVIERVDLNLFFNKPPMADWDVDGEDFEIGRAMLPPRWKELYRWFDSFSIIDNWMGGHVIRNTPFDFSSRKSFETIIDRYPIKKADFKYFENSIGSKRMRCWLDTEAGDSLWLDETNCDHKVYHTKNGNLKDYFILPDPENILDEYLAHYVAGGSAADFDFRKITSINGVSLD